MSRDQHEYVDSESIRGGEGSQIEEDENVLKFTGKLCYFFACSSLFCRMHRFSIVGVNAPDAYSIRITSVTVKLYNQKVGRTINL